MKSRLDFWLLSIMKKKKAFSGTSGITLKEMDLNNIGYKNNTVQKRLYFLINNNEVERGISEGHQYSYFITKKGLDILESEINKNGESK